MTVRKVKSELTATSAECLSLVLVGQKSPLLLPNYPARYCFPLTKVSQWECCVHVACSLLLLCLDNVTCTLLVEKRTPLFFCHIFVPCFLCFSINIDWTTTCSNNFQGWYNIHISCINIFGKRVLFRPWAVHVCLFYMLVF